LVDRRGATVAVGRRKVEELEATGAGVEVREVPWFGGGDFEEFFFSLSFGFDLGGAIGAE
jgi:hypothetical protein